MPSIQAAGARRPVLKRATPPGALTNPATNPNTPGVPAAAGGIQRGGRIVNQQRRNGTAVSTTQPGEFRPRGNTPVNPQDAFRGTRILPGTLGHHNRNSNQARQILGGAQLSPQEFEASGAANEARGLSLDSLRGLSNRRSETDLAADALDIVRERRAPQLQQDLRLVGQRAAALGRVGAGVTTNELTDVFTQRQRDEDFLTREVLNDAATRQFGNDALTAQILGQGAGRLRGEDLAESQFEFGTQSAAAQLALQRALGLESINNNEFQRGVTTRNETRAERGREDALAQQGIENRIRELTLGDQLKNSELNRELARSGLIGQLSRPDVGALERIGTERGSRGSNTADIFSQIAINRGTRGTKQRRT